MAFISTDVVGKVNNTKIKPSQGFIAVFEAIANSIHSIEDAAISDGKIEIEFTRQPGWLFNSQSGEAAPIQNIKIIDNGIGFNNENFLSFLNSDSTYKVARGGKGVGRFSWLKVFNFAEIKSTFQDNGQFYHREFQFENNKNSITGTPDKLKVSGEKQLRTEITLHNVKPDFISKFPLTLSEFADKIIEHHIAYLVEDSCPQIIVREIKADSSDEIQLNNRFKHDFLLSSDADSYTINNYIFNVALLKIKANDSNVKHSIFYSAHNRVVTVTSLSQEIPDLSVKLLDSESGYEYNIVALISGIYLDYNVNVERTRFYLPTSKKKSDVFSDITMADLDKKTGEVVRNYFEPELEALRANKLERIDDYVSNYGPQFRPIMEYQEKLDSIQPDLPNDKLAMELYRIRHEISMDAITDFNEVIELGKLSGLNASPEKIQEFKDKFADAAKKITSIGKSELVDYVLQRRLIIELFEDILGRRADGEYEWEEDVHNLIFPKQSSSDTIGEAEQNLWLVDERLAYHKFLASDQSIDKTKDGRRPDILVGKGFENSKLYADSSDGNYNSLVVIEFKRPMRKGYAKDDDPIAQVTNYIIQIREGKAETPKGRTIKVSDNCRFYAYVICDITPKIEYYMAFHGFTKMPDEQGYFKPNPALNAHIEVISYDKIVSDSIKRNRIFFDKLGINKINF